MPDDELLTLDEVAAKLKVSRSTARQLCVSGRLPWVPAGTGKDRHIRRVRKSTLAAFMQNERRDAATEQMRNITQTLAAMRAVEERW